MYYQLDHSYTEQDDIEDYTEDECGQYADSQVVYHEKTCQQPQRREQEAKESSGKIYPDTRIVLTGGYGTEVNSQYKRKEKE